MKFISSLLSLIAMAGLSLRPGRNRAREFKQALAEARTPVFQNLAGCPANTAPMSGWWNRPQSDESIAFYKKRAANKRARRFNRRNPSNYSVRIMAPEMRQHLGRLATVAVALLCVLFVPACQFKNGSALSLDPMNGVCWKSPDGKQTICVNPITRTATFRSVVMGYPVQLRYDQRSGEYRGTMPDGTVIVYGDDKVRFEPGLPVEGAK